MDVKDYYTDIKGPNYNKLLDLLKTHAYMFAFVTRTDVGINHKKQNIVNLFTPYLLDDYETNSWHSNEVKNYKLIGHIYFVELNEETINLLKSHSKSLFEWGDGKFLPEDLAFFDKKKRPVLTVNGHENYFTVMDDFISIFENSMNVVN